jgi:hypothetical protein
MLDIMWLGFDKKKKKIIIIIVVEASGTNWMMTRQVGILDGLE